MSAELDDMTKGISAENVVEYLNQNSEFFHRFPELVHTLSVPHPKTGKTVSLLERQIFELRAQKNRLQEEVDTLTDIAGENGVLLNKVYAFAVALMQAESDQAAVDVVYASMQSNFNVEQVALLSWNTPNKAIEGFNQLGVRQHWSIALKQNLVAGKPSCGLVESRWQKGLFSTDEPMRSSCMIPLGRNEVWGVLALGSTEQRFSSDLGTYFLGEIGNFVTARLESLFKVSQNSKATTF